MSCTFFDQKALASFVEQETFPKVKYNHEMSIMNGHNMDVTWTYEDYEVTEHLSDAELIFTYQDFLINAGLI